LLLAEARDLKINLSQACERGLALEVSAAKARQWQMENRAAIEAWNQHVEQHGLPLAEFRRF
jgi:antitoxin CcdA